MKTHYKTVTTAILFLVLATVPYVTVSAQTAVGSPILGTLGNDRNGDAVATSADGTIVATGAPTHNGVANGAGQVRVFRNVNGTWQQLGNTLNGTTADEWFGKDVALSDNGLRLVVGASRWDLASGGRDQGKVQVFDYSAATQMWSQVGNTLEGQSSVELFGQAVAMSANGQRMVVGGPLAPVSSGVRAGRVEVYELTGNVWQSILTVRATSPEDQLGASVDISADGTRVAMGAPNAEPVTPGVWVGEVIVYIEPIPGIWGRAGASLVGDAHREGFGETVALSADGSRLAVGAPFSDVPFPRAGRARVYEFASPNYVPVGNPISGADFSDRFGTSVALSQDGKRLVVGAELDDVPGRIEAGSVTVYDESGANWTPSGMVPGPSIGGLFGYDVAIADDGLTFSVGEPTSRAAGVNGPGTTHTYSLSAPLPVEFAGFSAFAKTGHVDLAWETASERGASHFDVERSGDGVTWAAIGTVAAAGDSDVRVDYAFTDEAPASGVNYYRLRQVDVDGAEDFSGVEAAYVGSGVAGLDGVVAYPNPAQDYVALAGLPDGYGPGGSGGPDGVTARLMDVSGREVAVLGFGASRILLRDVPAGVYALIVDNESSRVVRRVIVE